MSARLAFIRPDWPAPGRICAATTTRTGGVSAGPYATLNLGARVGDRPEAVSENRRRVADALELPSEPAWLAQVHGTRVARIDAGDPDTSADAAVTGQPGRVCALLTADCLPVLLCDRSGTRVGAAHAGWRGLAAGVIEATLRALGCDPPEALAWLGPAIGPAAFEVGDEVREHFLARDPEAEAAFVANDRRRWQADLYTLARRRLAAAGVTAVYGGSECTYREPERFFSYRRDGQCGRMGTLIWIAP